MIKMLKHEHVPYLCCANGFASTALEIGHKLEQYNSIISVTRST